MISVEEAEERIRRALSPTPLEWVDVASAGGRVLAQPLAGLRDQPAGDVSAMDGYAVRAGEARAGARLVVEGEVAAGQADERPLAAGTARRIFTGGLVPAGADTILIQEDARRAGDRVEVLASAAPDRHIRRHGQDFTAGAVMLEAGRRLGARDLGLAVALGHGHVPVRRRPRVGIAGTGDELVAPGLPTTKAQVPNSNAVALAAAVRSFGGAPHDLGIVRDRPEEMAALAERAQGLDLLVTTGGASVGDHDLVRSALGAVGLELDFWKIAMRPGKPLLFGRLGEVPVLGLPGNPVSALVCTLLFVRAALERLCGAAPSSLPLEPAELATALQANGDRQDFVRGRLQAPFDPHGPPRVRPAERQDSAMLAALAQADCLVVRPAFDPPAAPGSLVKVVRFTAFAGF